MYYFVHSSTAWHLNDWWTIDSWESNLWEFCYLTAFVISNVFVWDIFMVIDFYCTLFWCLFCGVLVCLTNANDNATDHYTASIEWIILFRKSKKLIEMRCRVSSLLTYDRQSICWLINTNQSHIARRRLLNHEILYAERLILRWIVKNY